jgi:hypothetical protein
MRRPWGAGGQSAVDLPLEHGAMHPPEGLILAHLEPATGRFAEHAKHGRPRDDPHDRPTAARVAANIDGMGSCRGHRARRGG